MPETPATAAFSNTAAQLKKAGVRLDALTAVVDQQFSALVGRLGALPLAAGFAPFGAGALGAVVAAAAKPADEHNGGVDPPRTVPGRTGPLPKVEAASTVRPSADGDWISPRLRALIDKGLSGASIDSKAATGARAAATPARPQPQLPSATDAMHGLFGAASAGRTRAAAAGVPPAVDLPAIAVQSTAAAVKAVAKLLDGVVGQRKATQAYTDALSGNTGAHGMLPASLLINMRLKALADATTAALAATPTSAPRPKAEREARSAVPAIDKPVATRAQSRLLTGGAAGLSAAVAAGTNEAEPAHGTPPRGHASPASAESASEIDLVAAINRLLVDQAWMRGVDLT
jgi:hypothetical protein